MNSKKIISLMLALIIMFILTACQSVDTSTTDQTTKNDTIITSEYNLDKEHSKELENTTSNAEITDINEKYAEKWKSTGDGYYTLILSDYSNSTKTKEQLQESLDRVTLIHDNMLEYIDERLEIELKRLQDVYQSGSIVPVEMSNYEYKMYRDYALEMYRICQDMNVSCNNP